MVKFDFVESASQAYQYCWQNRRMLLALSAGLLVFKCFSFLMVVNVFSDQNILRQNLIMIPAYFWEGLIIAKVICMAMGRYSAPAQETKGISVVRIDERAAAIVYTLIKLTLFFVGGMTMVEQQKMVESGASAPVPDALTFFMAIWVLGLIVWAFRLLWLYVPVAMGYTMPEFLKRFRGFLTSFLMMGTWIICFAPLALVLIVLSQFIAGMLGIQDDANPGWAYSNLTGLVQVSLDFIISLVSSLGMAYAFHSVLKIKK